MARINVPQELVNQIINLYINKNYTRVQIKKELNLPFGDSVIKRLLEENNIQIRTNAGAQKGGRKKQEVSKELQNKIINAYVEQGYGLNKIVRELQLPFSFDKVRSILKENNIKIRSCKEAQAIAQKKDLRKYSINDNYIFESHNGAYILGFIASDGYLPITNGAQNRVILSLQRQDREILEKIAKELEYTGPIYDYEATGGYPASSLSFTSKKLRQQIERYGIGNNKTFKLKNLPNLPKKYLIDFIRGFFDGDGSIYETKDHKIGTSITCASKEFLQEIKNFLESNYSIQSKSKIYATERVHVIYDFRYRTKDSLIFCNAMYNNNYLALNRKKQHYLELKEKYSH